MSAGAPPRPDAELVAAFVGNEPGAPAELWDRYYPFVRGVLTRAVGPRHDVEDLVQETFMRLFRKLPTLRDPASLKSFILSITTRVIQSELRMRWVRRWLGLFSDGEMPEHAGDEADLEAREALARFYKILDRLSPEHRSAFVLRYVEGLELADVAAALEVSLATIKRWLPRIAKRVFSQAQSDPLLASYIETHGSLVVAHG